MNVDVGSRYSVLGRSAGASVDVFAYDLTASPPTKLPVATTAQDEMDSTVWGDTCVYAYDDEGDGKYGVYRWPLGSAQHFPVYVPSGGTTW